jgi:hypothetical protein
MGGLLQLKKLALRVLIPIFLFFLNFPEEHRSDVFFSSVEAQVPSRLRWQVLESDHFKVIYSEDQIQLAEKLLTDLEKGRLQWVPYFSAHQNKKLPVAIMDTLDVTNGFAAPLPYAYMGIYPVLPAPQDGIYEHQDWFYELAVHELGHLYTFETRTGAAKALHSVFGQIITPNIFLPRWWHEGLAVTGETYLSKGGRLRSNYQDASLRALSQAGRLTQFFPLEQINQFDLPRWPYGAVPYLFGSLFFHELENLNPRAGKALHERLGGTFPFFLESSFVRTYQRVPQSHFDQTLARAHVLAQKQIQTLKKVPPSDLKPLFPRTATTRPSDTLETFAPALSPDGKLLAFVARDSSRRTSLKIHKRNPKSLDFFESRPWGSFSEKESFFQEPISPIPKPGPGFSLKGFFNLNEWIDFQSRSLPQNLSIQRLFWHPNGEAIVFDSLGRAEPRTLRSDLWIFDLKKGRASQWTRGLRLREASVSPDGKWVVAIQLGAGSSRVVILPFPSKTFPLGRIPWRAELSESKNTPSHPWLTSVYEGELGSVLSWPIWINTNEIAFVKKEGLTSKLMRLLLAIRSSSTSARPQIQTLGITPIDLPAQDISYPLVVSSAKAPAQIWFVGNESGVRNIYSMDLDPKYPQQTDQSLEHKKLRHSTLRAESHLLTQSFSFVVDPWQKNQPLILTQLTADGVQLHQALPLGWKTDKLPKISTLYPELNLELNLTPQFKTASHSQTQPASNSDPRPNQGNSEPIQTTTQKSIVSSEPKPYSSFPYLLPNYWVPLVLFDEQGVYFSAQTSSSDPLQRHSYSLFASFDSKIEKTSFSLLYSNQVFYPSWGLIAQDFYTPLAGQKQFRQNSNYTIAMDLPLWNSELPIFDRDSFFNPKKLLWNFELSAGLIKRTLFSSPSEGTLGRLGIRYQNLSQSGQQVGPEDGSAFSARYYFYDLQKPVAVNSQDQQVDKAELSYSQFWRMTSAFHNSTQLQLHYSQFLKSAVPLSLYDSSENLGSLSVPRLSQLQLRGFAPGTFVAKNYLSGSLNWSFSMGRIDRGNATAPWYVKRVVGSLGFDGAQLKGLIYDRSTRSYLVRDEPQFFFSTGLDLKWEMTLLFLADLGVVTGVHFPFAHRDLTDTSPYWVIGLAAAGF